MKRYWIVIVVVLAAVLGAVGLVAGSKRTRQFQEQITLRKEDKVPYGYYAAYRLLPTAFPGAQFTYSKLNPWNVITDKEKPTALFFIGDYIDPSDGELEQIASIAAAGNDVFFICSNMSSELQEFFNVSTIYTEGQYTHTNVSDSPTVQLQAPVFTAQTFSYPGKTYFSPLTINKPVKVLPLGRLNNAVYFVGGQVGKGRIYLHTAPLLLSNYFLLYRNNTQYLAALAGLVSKDVSEVVWSDYFLLKTNRNYKEPSWLGVLWKYEAFRWGLSLLAITALLYLLFNSQRKQRPVPVQQPLVNDSLEYVATIGGLYYYQADHANLALKMKQHFADVLRSRYFIDLNAAGENAAVLIAEKTGYPLADAKDLLYHLSANQPPAPVDDADLHHVHNLLQKFYKHNL